MKKKEQGNSFQTPLHKKEKKHTAIPPTKKNIALSLGWAHVALVLFWFGFGVSAGCCCCAYT